MDAALDGTSVGAVSAGASSFSFFAAARVAASARLADLHKRISKGNHQKCTRERDIIETIGRRRFPKRKNRKRERERLVPALVTTRRRRRRRPRRRRGDRRRQRHYSMCCCCFSESKRSFRFVVSMSTCNPFLPILLFSLFLDLTFKVLKK